MDDDGVVPTVLLQWMTLHAQSDVDLARLSNVCKFWRLHVTETLRGAGESSLLLPSMMRHAADSLSHNSNNSSNSSSNNNSSSADESFCAAWFHSDGVQTVKVTSKPVDEDHLHKRQKAGYRDTCYEWRGYRYAANVLAPFGYAPHFISSLFPAYATKGGGDDTAYIEPTVAVRGATFARPEGYCPCWDEEEQEQYNKYSQMIRQQQRTMLQRQLLPRLVQRTLPDINGAGPTSLPPAIQFLSASGTNAVRLLTAPFACGPIVNKMTIFCVGIATEDGCFMSGLKRRCELGHMYPQTDRDNLIDMSCICVATNVQFESGDNDDDDDSSEDDDEEDDNDDDDNEADNDDGGGEQEGSHVLNDSDLKRRASLHGACSCPYNANAELFDVDTAATEHEEDLKPPDLLHRGQRGPGQWHCYVAIMDGSNGGTIRIDGVTEPMVHLKRGGTSNNNNNNSKVDTSSGRVVLDGLTIGSDHSFDMSLCFGEGAPGEGEGSIAELAVFQGTLPFDDVKAMEQHLMAKHGIEPTVPGRQLLLQQEDEWKRDSRALIEQGVPYNMVVPEGVPLRVVAKDPSVSWHRTNAVTGEDIRVGRIGSRLSTGSSDW